ncbi:hypothetical protein FG386_000452 [Cryptosporidium ryanae]|uniref:uncharacterized protein n=1 Tax=Cryptosporidium ryanae TaxID=515981 RepID=UPI00351A4448|nr:hypothetical protein FG386_000452 [Cryptosporidium ryanae]
MSVPSLVLGENCDGELSKIALEYTRKQVNDEKISDYKVGCHFDKKVEGIQVDKEIMDAIDYCENKKTRFNLKRRRTENNNNNNGNNGGINTDSIYNDDNSSINPGSSTKLTGIIGQYLLSRIPLPTTRSDLQRKFTKSKGNSSSKKINLDEILSNINNIFKSVLGLGIFGLNRNLGTTNNPKYYVVQLNNSKSYLDSIYRHGYINYKHIGELSAYQNGTENFLSPKICNNFISFLSFLFGFFSITSFVDGDENEDVGGEYGDNNRRETNQRIEKTNDDDIEISNGTSFIYS